MKRDLYEILCQWKNDKNRRPLLVRGARQVGKTFLVNEFGRREFDSLVTLNFERNPEYREIFNSLEPRNILEKITLFTGKRIEPGKTLIFFDEVQDCASAIMALRYFYEEMRLLHIIAAGSLVVAEQFVGHELLAYQNPYSKPLLYYWAREAKNSNAELDYIIQKEGRIIPFEVKSGLLAE